jgi:hypothetical protein
MPSAIMAADRIVAVVVPSPAVSFVLAAACQPSRGAHERSTIDGESAESQACIKTAGCSWPLPALEIERRLADQRIRTQ